MEELIYRTEDISNEDLKDLFVETKLDRQIIDALKAPSPVIIVGSRGVGKSFLLRMAENELNEVFKKDRVLPIYVSFNRSSLIHTANPRQFTYWMLSSICSRIIRTCRKLGYLTSVRPAISILGGGDVSQDGSSKIEDIITRFENSWQSSTNIDTSTIPTIDDFKDAVDELCEEFKIKRINLLIDEAAHVFRPEQQRQFFTLFRDLRTSRITCNAAVYPGVTFFGDSFQPIHDATFQYLDRDIFKNDYVSNMREIVEKQMETGSSLLKAITKNASNFSILAYAASGNPRILLKTIARADKMNSSQINEVFREYYKTELWAEHSLLAEKYLGHKEVIDWGRRFIETEVLPELQSKNIRYLEDDKKTTCFFWLSRDTPQAVKEAIRLLLYTGIVTENAQGIKGTRDIGTRYQVNLGTLLALESNPPLTALTICKNFDPRRMSEYGMNYHMYSELDSLRQFADTDTTSVLSKMLTNDIEMLDLADWQKKRLREINISTIGEVLKASESKLMEGHYIGEKRARRMKSAALTSVYEYLSG